MPWECGAQCMLLTPEAISIHFSFKPSSSPQWSVSAFSKAKALNFTLTYMFVLAITRETYSCCCCTKMWVNIKVNNHPAVFLAVYLVQWKQLWSSYGKEQGSLSQVLQKLYGLLLKTLIINSSLSPAKAVRMGMIQRHRSRRVTEICLLETAFDTMELFLVWLSWWSHASVAMSCENQFHQTLL